MYSRAENCHQPTRERERRFLAAYGPIAAHFRPRRHRLTADGYRRTSAERFQTWRVVTGCSAMT